MRIRNNKVNVFLSDDEKFILKRDSSKLNLSQSEYIRNLIIGYEIKIPEVKEEQKPKKDEYIIENIVRRNLYPGYDVTVCNYLVPLKAHGYYWSICGDVVEHSRAGAGPSQVICCEVAVYISCIGLVSDAAVVEAAVHGEQIREVKVSAELDLCII